MTIEWCLYIWFCIEIDFWSVLDQDDRPIITMMRPKEMLAFKFIWKINFCSHLNIISEQWWRHFSYYFCEVFHKSINSTKNLLPQFTLSLQPLYCLQSDWLLLQLLRTASFTNQNNAPKNYLSVQSVQNSWCRPTAAVEARWSVQRRPAWPQTQNLCRSAACKENCLCESSCVCNKCQSVCANLCAVSDTGRALCVGMHTASNSLRPKTTSSRSWTKCLCRCCFDCWLTWTLMTDGLQHLQTYTFTCWWRTTLLCLGLCWVSLQTIIYIITTTKQLVMKAKEKYWKISIK